MRPVTAQHCYECGVCIHDLDHHCPCKKFAHSLAILARSHLTVLRNALNTFTAAHRDWEMHWKAHHRLLPFLPEILVRSCHFRRHHFDLFRCHLSIIAVGHRQPWSTQAHADADHRRRLPQRRPVKPAAQHAATATATATPQQSVRVVVAES